MKLYALVMLLASVLSIPTPAAQTPAQSPASSSAPALDFDVVAGGPNEDQTGLKGFYAIELNYSMPRPAEAPNANAADPADAPSLFTALQEQLGLKLQPRKIVIPVLVIDHLERPTEN